MLAFRDEVSLVTCTYVTTKLSNLHAMLLSAKSTQVAAIIAPMIKVVMPAVTVCPTWLDILQNVQLLVCIDDIRKTTSSKSPQAAHLSCLRAFIMIAKRPNSSFSCLVSVRCPSSCTVVLCNLWSLASSPCHMCSGDYRRFSNQSESKCSSR